MGISESASLPPWRLNSTRQWFSAREPVALARCVEGGRHRAFQMLCWLREPRSQGVRIHDSFDPADVAVPPAYGVPGTTGDDDLARRLPAQYRIRFPVGVDVPDGKGMPKTMAAYRMQGTPTLILIDRLGRLRAQHFGSVSDLQVGAEIMMLMLESPRA